MNIKTILGLVLLVAVAGGAWWVWQEGPAPAAGALPASTFNEEGAYTSVTVEYPAAPARERAIIEAELALRVAEFKQNTANLDSTVMPSLDGRKLVLDAEYTEHSGAGTHAYFYTIYEDTGGAHPNGYFASFAFDTNGNRLSLGDVLGGNPNWLEELSLVVSQDVSRQAIERVGDSLPVGAEGPDVTGVLYPEGLAAVEANFQHWFIDGETLVIMIPPYQVAAYAMGSFEVRVPLADINK